MICSIVLIHYEYLVMPFVLTNTPAVFQALLNKVFRDMLNVFVYLDDILIFSQTLTHKQHINQVLQHLPHHNLYVKAENLLSWIWGSCLLAYPFLGYVIAEGLVKMDPEKLCAMREWPTQSTWKQVQPFLGFASFYWKFIRNFSSIAAPLHSLTSSSSGPHKLRMLFKG